MLQNNSDDINRSSLPQVSDLCTRQSGMHTHLHLHTLHIKIKYPCDQSAGEKEYCINPTACICVQIWDAKVLEGRALTLAQFEAECVCANHKEPYY